MAKRGDKPKSKPATPSVLDEATPEALAAFLESFIAKGESPDFGEDPGEALESAFDDFLAMAAPNEDDDEDEAPDEDEVEEIIGNLAESLDQVRLNANGGDPEARAAMADFRRRLDEAITDGDVEPVNLILLAKILWKVGLPVGENLREVVGASTGDAATLTAESRESLAALGAFTIDAFTDPFDLYDEVASNMAAFPTPFRIAAALPVVASKKPVAQSAALGFLLHPDEALARAVIKALPLDAFKDDVLLDRLEHALSLLPPSRREIARPAVDAVKARVKPKSKSGPEIIEILASAHDGSSASSVSAYVKKGKRYSVFNLLLKNAGVADVIANEDITKKQLDQLMGFTRTAAPQFSLDLASASELLRLALGRTIAAGSPPPFRVVQFCEGVGLGAQEPDLSDAEAIIAKLLADTHVEAGAAAKAHAEIIDSPYVDSWFEAGYETDALLTPIKTRKAALRKLIEQRLPTRRVFWATLCATSAFVMKHRKGGAELAWKTFALVGRDIASGKKLEEIPLMTRIAERSVEVHFEDR